MRDSLTFFRSYLEAASMLPPERYKPFVEAIASYAFDDIEPIFDDRSLEAMAFTLIKPSMDTSKKYKVNGAKKGVSKGSQRGLPIEKEKEKEKEKGKEKETEMEKETETEIETETETEKERIDTSYQLKEKNIKKRSAAFLPPTLEEVTAYCDERNNSIDPEAFIDYYQARGWELSKGRKVKDWQACIRTWEKQTFNKAKEEPYMPTDADYDFY